MATGPGFESRVAQRRARRARPALSRTVQQCQARESDGERWRALESVGVLGAGTPARTLLHVREATFGHTDRTQLLQHPTLAPLDPSPARSAPPAPLPQLTSFRGHCLRGPLFCTFSLTRNHKALTLELSRELISRLTCTTLAIPFRSWLPARSASYRAIALFNRSHTLNRFLILP